MSEGPENRNSNDASGGGAAESNRSSSQVKVRRIAAIGPAGMIECYYLLVAAHLVGFQVAKHTRAISSDMLFLERIRD